MRSLVIGIVGSGGDGVAAAGESLLRAFAQEGYFGILSKSSGAQIRGGESSCRLRVSVTPVLNPGDGLDLAVVHNWEDYLRLRTDFPVSGDTVVVYEQRTGLKPASIPLGDVQPMAAVAVPIEELAIKATGLPEAKEGVVVGLLSGWLGLPLKRGQDVNGTPRAKTEHANSRISRQAFAAGAAYARLHPLPLDLRMNRPAFGNGPRRVADGNEMCARGALFAGCKFFSAYPMAPASEIMQYMQQEIWKYGGTFLPAEDEIAAAAAAVGSAFAGVKSMTATSGPGFSLQTEVLGMASAAELPLVSVNVQRGGPATGMPTRQEQADLFAAVFACHGDVVRPILAPTNARDSFDITVEAFNIAEHYQTPVIVLSDQEIAQCKAIMDPVNPSRFVVVDRLEPTRSELRKYARFHLTEEGISPISHPGMRGGNYLAGGLEHDERGTPTVSGEMHARMNRKRLNKLNPLKKRHDLFVLEGDPDARIGLISWGNMAGIALEAVQIAQAKGIRVKLLIPKLLYPVAEAVYADFFASLSRCVVVEQSHQGQLHRILRMWTNVPREFMSVSKSGANRISPHEIVQLIRAMEQPAGDRFRSHYCDLLNII